MATYKNFHGTKEEYIATLVEAVKFWAKAFADATDTKRRIAYSDALNAAEQNLAAEGWDWEEIEALEVSVY